MESAFTNNAYQLPAYRKALEIFKISRNIAAYFGGDRHIIEMDISANPIDRYAGSLVSESLQLAPGVASALSAGNPAGRLRRINSIRRIAKKLRQHSRKLEILGVKEVEFLRLLHKEINKFEQLISEWLQHTQNSSNSN